MIPSNRRYAIVCLLVAMTLSSAAEAQRRRSAVPPGTSFGQPPVTGNCASFSPVRAGLKASYTATTTSGVATYTVTYISDSETETKTTQKVTTPQATADAETTLQYESVTHQGRRVRGLKRLLVKITTPVPVIGSTTVDTEILFTPSFILMPFTDLCVGVKWTSPPSVEQINVRSIGGSTSSTQTTVAWEGEVLAVENVTVPAGTFRSLKVRGYSASDGGVTPAISWTSLDHFITVKQETLDANGAVTQTVVLTGMQ